MTIRAFSKSILSCTFAAVLLSGCVTEGELLRDQGYPLAYTEGYDDGCSSGKKAGGSMFDAFKKDVHRFQDDRDYHDGWQDGHDECKSQFMENMRELERSQDRYERKKYYDKYRY
ncbi:hypothetical protein [Thiolapillus sp.]